MSARDLIHRAEAAGVLILASNGELVLRGEPSAVKAFVPEAKAHKTELLHELSKSSLPKSLERHIEYVAAFHGFTPAELQEAKAIAAGDIENAIPCFRRLLAEALAGNQEPLH